MKTKAEKIEQILHVFWGVEKTPILASCSEAFLRSAERGESEMVRRKLLADFQLQKLDQDYEEEACSRIIVEANKVIVGYAQRT